MPDISDVLTTWGREFAQAVASHSDEVSGQDGYEVLTRALGPDISLTRLKTLSDSDYESLAEAARHWLEAPGVTVSDLRAAVTETLWHWGGAD